MKHAILIIGAPGTGKTTLVRALLANLLKLADSRTLYETGLVPRQMFSLDLGRQVWSVLGKYEKTPKTYAEGTDRMSMGVQPHFEAWIKTLRNNHNLLIEGDRLANTKTILALQDSGYAVTVFSLEAPSEVLDQRYRERGSTQSAAFLKGRHTKVTNLVAWCVNNDVQCSVVLNSRPLHARKLQKQIEALIYGSP